MVRLGLSTRSIADLQNRADAPTSVAGRKRAYSAGGWASDQANSSAKEARAKSGGSPSAKRPVIASILSAKAPTASRSFMSATSLLSAHCDLGMSGRATRAAVASSARQRRVADAASTPARSSAPRITAPIAAWVRHMRSSRIAAEACSAAIIVFFASTRPSRVSRGRGIGGLQRAQAPFELGRFDGADIGLDHMAQLHRFARCHGTLRRCVGNRGHRTREVAGVADRRHDEFDCAFAVRPDDAFEAQPQRRRVARECQFDGFAGQGLALTGEQQSGCAIDVIAAATRPAGGIAGVALGKPPTPVPWPLFLLFNLVEIRHRQLHPMMSHLLTGVRCRKYIMRLWQLRDSRYSKSRTPVSADALDLGTPWARPRRERPRCRGLKSGGAGMPKGPREET